MLVIKFEEYFEIKMCYVLMFMFEVFSIVEILYVKDLKVGVVLVKMLGDGMYCVIFDGYNGMEFGEDNCCENLDGIIKEGVLYVEWNVFRKLLKLNENSMGSVLFVICSFCNGCVEYIIDVGVMYVYFCE